ncbi:ribosome recycling factor [Candidatus Poribacteria bacterium]|nr:ribosome recycling factor [Candidatus Poribacteria bacterium]MDE0686924.1 ribosome recycling factor [Candidatus Poribacteria bacterium]MXV85287.1 ribosome recycling factor [Candidatus Poribacteria bacterium]MYA58672.1 ribosome recycling factor [Candidatus Poribacteria bacterium]
MQQQILQQAESRMKKTVEATATKLSHVQTGRATPALLDQVSVTYYGSKSPLSQVGTITTPEPRLLVIQPWDKTLITEIEKAIAHSDLGLSTSNDGNIIRIQIPELTLERRTELTKVVRKLAEEGKVAIRNIRRDANDAVKKADGDTGGGGKSRGRGGDRKRGKASADPVQQLTDTYIDQINDLTEAKESELLET